MPALTQTRNTKLDIKVVTLMLGVQDPQGAHSDSSFSQFIIALTKCPQKKKRKVSFDLEFSLFREFSSMFWTNSFGLVWSHTSR